jgi:hypothetical protein
MLQFNHHPDNEGVIDQMTSAIYESEVFNYHADSYAFEVLEHYFGAIDRDWYHDYIGSEEFRGLDETLYGQTKKFCERLYDMYWDARGEWFYLMVSNLARKNLEEATRNMFQHTLTTNQSWDDYGKAIKRQHPRAGTHHQTDKESDNDLP